MMAQREISLEELRRSDGEHGNPRFIAHRGQVYDVSDCPKWRTGLQEGLRFPAQDPTGELAEAPHGQEVFERPCVEKVGWLVGEEEG